MERASCSLTFIRVLTLASLSLRSCILGDFVGRHSVDDGDASQ